jgi:hypothetical protein
VPFMVQRLKDLNSPVIQMFFLPFRKPWVIVNDVQE